MLASFRVFAICMMAVLLLGPAASAQVARHAESSQGGRKARRGLGRGARVIPQPEDPRLARADRPETLAGGRSRQNPRDACCAAWARCRRGPTRRKVKVVSREDHGRLYAGALRVPQRRRHGRARHPADPRRTARGRSRRSSACTATAARRRASARSRRAASSIGPLLAQRGYVVAAIDAYFNGEPRRQGSGRPEPGQGRLPAGAEPVQALPLAGPLPVGHDAARGAVPDRLPGNPARGGQDTASPPPA